MKKKACAHPRNIIFYPLNNLKVARIEKKIKAINSCVRKILVNLHRKSNKVDFSRKSMNVGEKFSIFLHVWNKIVAIEKS